jgi:hypothetical protein
MSDNDLQPTRDTPAITPDFVGVRVALSPARADKGPLALVGVFQLTVDEAAAIDAHPHRGLIVALASADGTIASAPFRERVFFFDDVHRHGRMVGGYFSVELLDPDALLPQQTFWISVSLGLHLSNVVGFGGLGQRTQIG